jgi:hypothetical protein
VLDHYRKNGVRVEKVDGVGSVDQVFEWVRSVFPLPLQGEG